MVLFFFFLAKCLGEKKKKTDFLLLVVNSAAWKSISCKNTTLAQAAKYFKKAKL